MYHGLLEDAKKENIKDVLIHLLVENQSQFLLLEQSLDKYELPSTTLKSDEDLSQGIKRCLIESTNLELEEVDKFLCHFDKGSSRHFYFVIHIEEPREIYLRNHLGFTWDNLQEVHGYSLDGFAKDAFDVFRKQHE